MQRRSASLANGKPLVQLNKLTRACAPASAPTGNSPCPVTFERLQNAADITNTAGGSDPHCPARRRYTQLDGDVVVRAAPVARLACAPLPA
jgi:hypothetical protein